MLVRSKGLVAPLGTLPCAYVGERTRAHAVACLGGPGAAADELAPAPRSWSPAPAESFLAQIGDVLRVARFDVQRTTDVTGVELAARRRNAAVLAASAAAPAGARAAGAAADRVLAEVDAYARSHGGHPESFADLAGDRRQRPGARRPATARRRPARGRRRRPGRRRARRGRRRARRARALGRGRDAAHPHAIEARCLSRLRCVDKVQLDREFSDLYRAHLRDVYSYAYYRVGNHHDAEDLTEQTFLQAYRHYERALRESDGRPLRPWLIRIAHNLAANLYRDRARKPQTPIEDTGTLSALHTTEDLVEGRDELARILEGVKELPDDRRDALIMRFALGMDNREIARAMGRTDGATKVLIHRAIKQLEEIVVARGGAR